MDVATQRRLVGRILSHLDQKTTDSAGAERYVAVDDYLDPDRFDRELRQVLLRRPLLFGHASQLAEPGDFVTDQVLGVPVVALRTPSGALRGHVNVCRHRGARLVEASSGSGLKDFTCPYHSWHYSAEGLLRHVPEQARFFPALDTGQRSLVPVPLWERHGLLWVDVGRSLEAPGGDGADVGAFLGPLADDFASYAFERDVLYGSETLNGAFNWKLGVEAFLEVYHFRSLHPDMKKYVFVPEVSLLDRFGDHLRVVAPKRDIRELIGRPEEEWLLRPHATVVYFLFPSTFLFVEKRHASTLQIRPVTLDTSEVRILHVVRQDGLERRETLDVNIGLFMKAVSEDLGACESIQKGLRSPQRTVVFGRNEIGLHSFRDAIERALLASGVAAVD